MSEDVVHEILGVIVTFSSLETCGVIFGLNSAILDVTV